MYMNPKIDCQSIMFEASDRSCSLSLAQINNLGSNLSLASIAKITRCLQVFISTKSFLSIRFTRKVYRLYNAVFRAQLQEHRRSHDLLAAQLSNEWTSVNVYYV